MNRIKQWYQGLSDQWKATLRTAWQTVAGALAVFVLAALTEAIGLINGGDWSDAVDGISNASRVFGLAVLTVAVSVVTYWMNRGSKGATFPPPPPPPPAE